MDRTLRGIPASPGIAVGTVHVLHWEVPDVPHHIIQDEEVPRELKRLDDAIEAAKERLTSVRDRVEATVGKEEAAIFDVQHSILEDPDLLDPPLDRSFKKPGGYVMRDKLAAARARAGTEKPAARATGHDRTGGRRPKATS